jgi:hypothetical protein
VKTSDDGTYQTYALPGGVSGTVFVRVTDTDGSRDSVLDSILIDHMFFRSVS